MRRRVAVTGVGLVSCLGREYGAVLERLAGGMSGLRRMPEWSSHGLKSLVAGPIDRLDTTRLPKRLAPAMSDAATYCSLAALDAVADADLTSDVLQDRRTGCLVGSGVGSVDAVSAAAGLYLSDRLRRVDPYTVLRCMSSGCSAAVANLLKIRGRSYSLSSACATASHNIGHAYELIREGRLDRAVAGGGEDISELIAVAFSALRLALSTGFNDTPTRASRPYDRRRDGFVLSGGGGIVVLEDLDCAVARGARVRAEVTGFGATSEGFDLVLPDPSGRHAAECVQMALDDAGLKPSQVDYINTHGTSTMQGDIAEVSALRQVFGAAMPLFSSTKSMTGHALGAAGALELIFCVGMLERGFVAPSINVEEPDPAVAGLPLVTTTAYRPLRTAITTSFGFGGSNATLVLQRYPN